MTTQAEWEKANDISEELMDGLMEYDDLIVVTALSMVLANYVRRNAKANKTSIIKAIERQISKLVQSKEN